MKQRHTDNISHYNLLALPIGIIESERSEHMWHVVFSVFVEKEIDTSTIVTPAESYCAKKQHSNVKQRKIVEG